MTLTRHPTPPRRPTHSRWRRSGAPAWEREGHIFERTIAGAMFARDDAASYTLDDAVPDDTALGDADLHGAEPDDAALEGVQLAADDVRWPHLRRELADAATSIAAATSRIPGRRRDPVTTGGATELDACFEQIKRIEGATAAIKARLIEVAAEQKAHEAAGLSDTGAYLRQRLGVSGREAKRQAELSKGLSTMDGAVDALAEGRLGVEQAGVLSRAARGGRLGDGEQVQRDLLDTATSSTPEDLQRTVRQREQDADADALQRDENQAFARRRAWISKQPGGMWALRAELDPLNGEVVATAIRAFTTPDPVETPPEQRRSTEKRTADGLLELAQAALHGDSAPEAGGTRPHISVIVLADEPTKGDADGSGHRAETAGDDRGVPDAESYMPTGEGSVATGEDGSPPGEGSVPTGQNHRPLFGSGVTGSGTVLSPEATARLVCDSALSRIVMGAPSQVLDVGRTKRAWSAPQRRAIVARDGHCRGPGCDRPASWCDIHHVHWWRHGGSTDLNNGLLLCRYHHRMVHEGGWKLIVDTSTGRASFIDRRGKEQATLPRSAPALLEPG